MSGASDRDDVQQRLERLGATPDVAPRPEFAEDLLARLLGSGVAAAVVTEPAGAADDERVQVERTAEVIDLGARRRRIASRLAVAASVAAVTVAVFGIANARSGGGPDGQVASVAAAAQLRSGDVVIDATGHLRDTRGGAIDIPDGTAELSCATAITFMDSEGNAYRCRAGATVEVDIVDGAIADSTGPTVVPQPRALVLTAAEVTPDRADQPLEWSWEPYDGPRFGSYRLLRTQAGGMPEVVAEITDVTSTAFAESVPLRRTSSYQLVVVAPDGAVVGRSNFIRVNVG